MAPTRTAQQDLRLSAVVTSRTPLYYEEGADPSIDRPAHVRSGSGLGWLRTREKLVIIQDDASFLALVDPITKHATSVTLPWERGGRRQFDSTRGNKSEKLDLEACIVVPIEEGVDRLVAFGSGSSSMREKVLVVDFTAEDLDAQLVDASSLYKEFRARTGFSGSELNIEGACIVGGTVRFFQRGNGSASGDLPAIDATCDVDLMQLLSYLDAPQARDIPSIGDVHVYDLNQIENVKLTFTDATMQGDSLYFLAAAEASPNAVDDGPVAGVVIGIANEEAVRFAPLASADGAPFLLKAEGLVPNPYREGEFFIVTDRDDPELASELCTVLVSFV